MGKGDKKTTKGKRKSGSYGVTRKRTKIGSFVSDLVSKSFDVTDVVKEDLKKTKKIVSEKTHDLAEDLSDVKNKVVSKTDDVVEKIKEDLKEVKKKVSNKISDLTEDAKEIVEEVKSKSAKKDKPKTTKEKTIISKKDTKPKE